MLKLGRQEMKVDDIVAVASVIKQTEDILQQKRNCVVSSEHMRYLSRDLMNWSGYGKLKNLLFYLVLCQTSSNHQVAEEHVDEACNIMLDLSSMCTLYRMSKGKIVNEVLTFVANNIINCDGVPSYQTVNKAICDLVSEEDKVYLLQNYSDMLSGKTSVFDNSRVYYFLLLSYADDCQYDDYKLENCYNDVLHREKWDIDIEHIHSRHFFDDPLNPPKWSNSLGNLLYLDSNINRILGNSIETQKVTTSEEDFRNKMSDNGYKNGKVKLVSPKVFWKKYGQERDWTEELAKKRTQEKKHFIDDIFKRILPLEMVD